MGSYVENLFRNQYILVKSTESNDSTESINNPYNSYTMILESDLYRSGINEIIEEREKRGQTPKKIFKNKDYPPQFYSSQHVAKLYGHPDGQYYTYRYKEQNLKLLSFEDPDLLNMIWQSTKHTLVDSNIILYLFQCLGYFPDERKTEDERNKYINWAKTTINNDSFLKLDVDYPDMSSTFNRISTSKNDTIIFNLFLNHTFSDLNLRNILRECDGLYFPPMNCGFQNTRNFMTLYGIFHEEVFLKIETIQRFDINTIVTIEKYLPFYPEAYHISDATNNETNERTYEDACIYIYCFQTLYEKIFSTFHTYIEDIVEMKKTIVYNYFIDKDKYNNTYAEYQEKAIDTCIAMLDDKNDKNYMTNTNYSMPIKIYELLQAMFLFNKDDFLSISSYTSTPPEDHFLFTVLRTFLMAGVQTFDTILANMDILNTFKVYSSGGMLFSIYSYGVYRKLTKDIDVKIGQMPSSDTIVNNQTQEEVHTILLIMIYVFENSIKDCLTYNANDRIKAYFEKLKTYGLNTSNINVYSSIKCRFHLGTVKTDLRRPEIYIDTLLTAKSNGYYEGQIFFEFHKFLENKKSNISDYINIIKTLLQEKKKIKQDIQELDELKIRVRNTKTVRQKKKVGGGNGGNSGNSGNNSNNKSNNRNTNSIISTSKTLKRSTRNIKSNTIKNAVIKGEKFENILVKNHNRIREINNILRYLATLFDTFITDNGYTEEYNQYKSISTIRNNRPSIGPNSFKIGDFSTIYIQTKTNKTINNYGLIDFTFDSSYALDGTYSYPSGYNLNTLVKYNSLTYISYIDFIKETIKLKNICSKMYEYEIYNKCSPDPIKRAQKKDKYEQRYTMVYNFAKHLFKNSIVSSDSLEIILEKIDSMLSKESLNSSHNLLQTIPNVPIHRNTSNTSNTSNTNTYVLEDYPNTEVPNSILPEITSVSRKSSNIQQSKYAKNNKILSLRIIQYCVEQTNAMLTGGYRPRLTGPYRPRLNKTKKRSIKRNS
jgi:hypothetical protein